MSKVLVAHPNMQHALQLAVGLQKADLLMALVTRLYTSWQHPPFSKLKWLPAEYRNQIEGKLFSKVRRSHPELNLDNVKVIDSSWALLPIFLRRVGLISPITYMNWLYQSSQRFQQKVAEMALEMNGVLVCYDRFAYHAFQQALTGDVKRVLDLSIAHPRTARRLLDEEIELWPELKASLELPGVTDSEFELVAEEADLADYVLAGSSFVRDSCVENGVQPDSVLVVNYGVDTIHFRPMASRSIENRRVVRYLFVGQIGQRKGIRYLLNAFAKLKMANVELWLCGTFAGIEDVLTPLPDSCKYLGHVPNSRMPEIYNQADVLLQPSVLEGFSLVILEAMACGLPVIATTHTGGQDVVTSGVEGFIVPPRDVDALAEAMLYLYENPDRRTEMGKAARKTAEKHSWDVYHQQVAKAFEGILDGSELR